LDTEHDDGRPARYRFVHDRVQQAAYTLIDDQRKQEVHLRIGRLMLAGARANDNADDNDNDLFTVVNHLNIGAPLMTDPGERRRLATLDLRAGKRARDAAAHGTAVSLLAAAQGLLGPGD